MTITQCNIAALILSHLLLTMSVLHKNPEQGLYAGLFGLLVSGIALGAARVVWNHSGKH